MRWLRGEGSDAPNGLANRKAASSSQSASKRAPLIRLPLDFYDETGDRQAKQSRLGAGESAKLKSRIAKGLSSRAGEREGGGGIGERTSSHTFGRTKKKDGSVKQREGEKIRQDEKT